MSTVAEIRQERNQMELGAELARVYRHLRRLSDEQVPEPPVALAGELPASLQCICAVFGLSEFERDVLLLAAGIEFESRFAETCASVQKDARARWATFSLAFAALPEGHWSAVTQDGPLRYWRLLELNGGDNLLTSPLRIDERILHFLAGVSCNDSRLVPYFHPAPPGNSSLSPAQAECADLAASYWTPSLMGAARLKPILLIARSSFDQLMVAQQACHTLRFSLWTLNASDIPANPAEREQLLRLWTREGLLTHSALYVRTRDRETPELTNLLVALGEHLSGPVFIEAGEGPGFERLEGLRIHVPALAQDERKAVWMESLGALAARINGGMERVTEQFRFDAETIRFAGTLMQNASEAEDDSDIDLRMWQICRTHARRSLDHLARRIEPKASWADLVLPRLPLETLHQVAIHVRQRSTVLNRWGFADRYSRGLGVTALFAGNSGTGKTMAAEVIAHDLDLDLYHVDLSAVVSKYIGETEKNLRRIFDASEESGAVLLFDEADALFGKRSEVHDSHDRYANLEISYLLQRMESYNGLAILTTNMKQSLDNAFLRRIRFVVQFPFPDAPQRQRIWQLVFPEATPIRDLDYARLAQLNIPGGTIRNIAMHAAYLAAEEVDAVTMKHILHASRLEYAKLERPLTRGETGGWA